jgi:hypothetical protein
MLSAAPAKTPCHDRVMRKAWIAGLLIACGGSPKAADAPHAPDATCESTAAHMIDVMAAPMDPPPPEDAVRGMVQMISKRCEQDRWSPEARRCLAGYKTQDDARVCETLLSDEQLAALAREGDKLGGGPKAKAPPDAEGGAGAGAAGAPADGAGAGPGGPGAGPSGGSTGKKDPQSIGGPSPSPPPPKGSSKGGTRGANPKGSNTNADPCDGGE